MVVLFGRAAGPRVVLAPDFVADQGAGGGSAYGTQGAAEYRIANQPTGDSADSGAHLGIGGAVGATPQGQKGGAEQGGQSDRTD